MTQAVRFRIDSSKVIHETFDDEVVLVNLDNGNYYSIDKVGADIWSIIERGADITEIVKEIAHAYEGDRGDMESAIGRFVAELQEEDLIVPAESKEAGSSQKPKVQAETGTQAERASFESPILHRYTDMQDLLLLDPIHEVDEAGWPRLKPDSSQDK